MNKVIKFLILKIFDIIYNWLNALIWVWESLMDVFLAICDENCELKLKQIFDAGHEWAWIRIQFHDFKSLFRIWICNETNTDNRF